ncbi:MAG: 50S ribosomal protein L19e [Candidatus Micrarchaeota archaeon]
MTIATVRRLAADIFNVGENKVKISPDGMKEAEGALTRSDVKNLIEKGIISKKKNLGRASTRKRFRRGHGHKKGSSTIHSKEVWMMKVRSQRKLLNMLISSGALNKKAKRVLYGKVKSGIFRNKKAFLLYLKDNEFIAKDYELEKPIYVPKKTKQPKKLGKKTTEVKKEPKQETKPEPKKGEKQ